MSALSEIPEYRPFPNERGRNWRQGRLEVPLLLRSLKLPEAPRMLEVGCGQGVALAALAPLTLFHIARADAGIAEIARVLTRGGLLVHETKISQLLSHPVRARARRVPWEVEPRLQAQRWAGLWATRVRVAD